MVDVQQADGSWKAHPANAIPRTPAAAFDNFDKGNEMSDRQARIRQGARADLLARHINEYDQEYAEIADQLATTLRETSNALHAYVTTHVVAGMTWQDFEAMCDDPEYARLQDAYELAKLKIRAFGRRDLAIDGLR
jgi:hypothetical protein